MLEHVPVYKGCAASGFRKKTEIMHVKFMMAGPRAGEGKEIRRLAWPGT
jgi:hypothetical protein